MPRPPLRRLIPWLPGAVCCLAAVLAAALVPGAKPSTPMTPELAQEAWKHMVGHEKHLREATLEHFPADPWSRDDDFASSERTRALQFRTAQGTTVQDVFRVVDLGLREHWPLPEGAPPPRATVSPLRPRPMD